MYNTIERLILLLLLFVLELVYLKIARRFNIIDMPTRRSSHKKKALRGGGIIFLLAVWIFSFTGSANYALFILGLTLVALVSFIDDIRPLSPRLRFVVQFVAMALMLWESGMFHPDLVLYAVPTLILGVCIINAYNFMDGINGITGAYSLMLLATLWLLNREMAFIDAALIEILMMAALVFCFFNFRNKAICFAGDVGSVGMAFCVIFILLKLIIYTGDVTYLIFLAVYGIDTLFTIMHRIMLRENLLKPHRKHLFQLLANEGGMSHVKVATLYVFLQFIISLGYIYLSVNKWVYSISITAALGITYWIIEQKLYPLHKKYLEQLPKAA